MRILAIDPGKRAGWAWIVNGYFVSSGVINGDSAWECSTKINLTYETDPQLVVCEDQYFGRMRGKGLFTLLRRRHIWEIFSDMYCIPFEAVHPKTWQSYWKIPQKGRGKQAILKLARTFKRDAQPDEADAILIGMWAAAVKQEVEK